MYLPLCLSLSQKRPMGGRGDGYVDTRLLQKRYFPWWDPMMILTTFRRFSITSGRVWWTSHRPPVLHWWTTTGGAKKNFECQKYLKTLSRGCQSPALHPAKASFKPQNILSADHCRVSEIIWTFPSWQHLHFATFHLSLIALQARNQCQDLHRATFGLKIAHQSSNFKAGNSRHS